MLDLLRAAELDFVADMAWATPQHPHGEVDDAGRALLDASLSAENRAWANAVVNNWRSSHHYPLNTFQITLRARARSVDSRGLVAQRIKRLSTIEAKLRRPQPRLTLSEMQDIGGCRAIVSTVQRVDDLVALYKSTRNRKFNHVLVDEDDYMRAPKRSGYRGVHLIYKHFSQRKEYDGLKIEMQFRTTLQHAWATTVETVGLFTKQALKSSQGEEGWLRFFRLMASEMAYRENLPLVPTASLPRPELLSQLKALARELRVEQRLLGYTAMIERMGGLGKGAHFFLVSLDPATRRASLRGYPKNASKQATEDYLRLEVAQGSADAVLVSADSVGSLKRAYPNYFADTTAFVHALRRAITIGR